MNVDRILAAFNAAEADYLLIGGMNFLLRQVPELTFDVDLWVKGRVFNGRYDECRAAAAPGRTASGIDYCGLSDAHMLETQLALDEKDRKPRRIVVLKKALAQHG